MAYIGNTPALQYITHAKQTFTADSATVAFTLSNAVANENELEVFVNNVRQEPGSGKAYTASGTTLTMSAAPNTGDDFYCIYQGKATQTVTPGASTVTNDMLSGSIANAKLANSSITLNSSAVSLGGSHTLANTPSWMVKRSANQSISNQVDTVLAFDQERFDTDSAYDNSTNYRFTVPSGKDGKYFVFALVSLTNFATNKPVNVSVRKNGSGFAAFQQTSGDYSDDCAAYVSQIFDASAGDYFDATCFHRGGSSFNANTNTCFGGYKLL